MLEVHAQTRPPRVLNVVHDPVPGDWDRKVDWSGWYLTDEEDMGESPEQGAIIRLLLPLLVELFRSQGRERVYVGADNFFAWIPAEPLVRVSPDVYMLESAPSPPLPASWQTWLPGHRPPALAFEIVSDDWKKDYHQMPEKYAQLGAGELVIFDPAAAVTAGKRVALQHYRRREDGNFVLDSRGPGPVRVSFLGAWVRVVRDGPVARLRLSLDADGLDLVPTPDEMVAAERMAREAERAAREAERTAREAAEAENARLREELERLRGR